MLFNETKRKVSKYLDSMNEILSELELVKKKVEEAKKTCAEKFRDENMKSGLGIGKSSANAEMYFEEVMRMIGEIEDFQR